MAYPPITTLPSPPSRQDPTNFADEADAFLGALPDFGTEANALAAYMEDTIAADAQTSATNAATSATAAATSATNAATSETNAATSATAAANSASSVASGAWSSGASYSVGDVVYSPITYLSYRAITTHSGETTDPSSDATNWVQLGGISGLTATAAELNKLDGATVTTAEINYLDITTLGTSEASKAVTADANGVVTFDNGISEEYNAVTSSSNATTVNLRDGTNFSHTLTENTTFTFSNPAASGKTSSFTLKLVQDASASGFTVTWPTSVDWPSATAPTLTATASAVDYFVFITHDGGTTYYGFTAGQALA
jgi:hypothetical protein